MTRNRGGDNRPAALLHLIKAMSLASELTAGLYKSIPFNLPFYQAFASLCEGPKED
jgi:hypothetical protein